MENTWGFAENSSCLVFFLGGMIPIKEPGFNGKGRGFFFHGSPRLAGVFFWFRSMLFFSNRNRTLLRREAWSGVAYAELRSDALGSSYEVQFNCDSKNHGPNTTGKFVFPNFQILRCQVPCQFFRGRLAKTEEYKLKKNTRNRKQLDLLFIWNPKNRGPKKKRVSFYKVFFVSFSTEPWSMEDTWRIIPGLVCG